MLFAVPDYSLAHLKSMKRAICLTALAILLFAGWCLSLGIIVADVAHTAWRSWLFALLGTMYGQASVAATWAAWGPGRLTWRAPLCVAWVGTLMTMWCAPMVLGRTSWDPELLMIGCSVLGQWLLCQIVLWTVRWMVGLRIAPVAARNQYSTMGSPQYGIRQLMLLTAAIAVTLGLGRIAAPLLHDTFTDGIWADAPFIAFIVAANLVAAMPIGIGALIPRGPLVGCGIALCFFALATWLELSLLYAMKPPDDEDYMNFWLMNGIQAAWMLLAAGLVRCAGFRVSRMDRTTKVQTAAS